MAQTWPELWFDLPLAVFDLETTGFDPATCQIIEIGITHFERGKVTDVYDQLIDPECTIPKEVVELTHITQDDVTGQPKLRDIAGDILNAFSGRGIVAYNIAFDRPFLTHKLEALNMKWPEGNPLIDPLVFAMHFYPNQRNKLGMVAERLGVSLEGAHRACNDAEATGHVLYAMRDRLPARLEELLIVQAEWEIANQARLQWRRKPNENQNNQLLAQTETSQGLSPAFIYGDETDPLRALYKTLPDVHREAKIT